MAKDRKGRNLSLNEIMHYQRMVAALVKTITLMEEINTKIDQHAGCTIQ